MAYPNNTPDAGEITLGEFLMKNRNGAYDQYLTKIINEVCEAVVNLGGKGSVTVKFDIEHLKDEDGPVTKIRPKVTGVKKPMAELPASVMFITDHGGMTRTDPRQMSMLPDADKDRERSITDRALSLVGRGRVIEGQAV